MLLLVLGSVNFVPLVLAFGSVRVAVVTICDEEALVRDIGVLVDCEVGIDCLVRAFWRPLGVGRDCFVTAVLLVVFEVEAPFEAELFPFPLLAPSDFRGGMLIFRGLASSSSLSEESDRFLLGAFGEVGNALIASEADFSPETPFFNSETLSPRVMKVHIVFVTLALDLMS